MSIGNTILSSSDFAQTIYCQTNRERFLTLAAHVKEKTGREMVVEKNADGEIINAASRYSTQRASFFVYFLRAADRVGNPDCENPSVFMTKVESIARTYAELRAELLERYKDDEDELYRQLGELNQAFEAAITSAFTMGTVPLMSNAPNQILISDMPQWMHTEHNRQMQEYETMKGLMQILQQNMKRHASNFFELFIKSIQSNDFDTAFSNTIDALNSNESSSMSSLSFRDAVIMIETLGQGHTRRERDEETGEYFERFIPNRLSHSFRVISGDNRIAEAVRREIADLLGFRWRG